MKQATKKAPCLETEQTKCKSPEILAMLAALFTIFVLLSAQSKLLPTRQTRTITLRAETLEEEVFPQHIWLTSARIDDDEVAFWAFRNTQNDGWEYLPEFDDYKALLLEGQKNSLSFDVYCESATFSFVSGEGCGAITISDGENTEWVDLTKEDSVTLNMRRSYSIPERTLINLLLFCILFISFYFLFVAISKIGACEPADMCYLWFCILWGMVVVWRVGLLPRVFLPYVRYNDTPTYMNYPWGELFHFNVTTGRTPVYPAFLEICRLLFGDVKQFYAVMNIQLTASLLGLIVLYDLLVRITRKQKLSAILAFAYGMNLDIAVWDYAILTESLALTMTIVFIDMIVRYIQKPIFMTGVRVILLALVMSLLRPTFLLFAAVLLGVWVLRLFLFPKERRILKGLCCVSLITFVVIGLYAFSFQKNFGYYSISDAMPRQNIISCIRRGYYWESENPEFVTVIEKHYDPITNGWNCIAPLFAAFGEKEAGRLAKQTLFSDIPRYIKDTMVYMGADMYGPFTNAYVESTRSWASNTRIIQVLNGASHIFQFSVGLIYIILFGQTVLLLIKFVREKTLPWVDFGIWGFLLVIPISTYVATCGEFPRTMIHILPFVYCSVASLITEATAEKRIKDL